MLACRLAEAPAELSGRFAASVGNDVYVYDTARHVERHLDKNLNKDSKSEDYTDAFELKLAGHSDRVTGVCLCSIGYLVSVSLDKHFRVWDLNTWECIRIVNCEQELHSVAFLPLQRILAVSSKTETLMYSIDSWNYIHKYESKTSGAANGFPKLDVTPTGKLAVAEPTALHIYDPESKTATLSKLRVSSLSAISVFSDGRVVAADDGRLLSYDYRSPNVVFTSTVLENNKKITALCNTASG